MGLTGTIRLGNYLLLFNEQLFFAHLYSGVAANCKITQTIIITGIDGLSNVCLLNVQQLFKG